MTIQSQANIFENADIELAQIGAFSNIFIWRISDNSEIFMFPSLGSELLTNGERHEFLFKENR